MPWLNPKIDWNGDTDYYNFEDMNRVENNTGVIKELIEFLQGNFSLEKLITDRNILSIDFADDLNRIETNIEKLKDNFYKPLNWEPVKTNWKAGDPFSYIDANRLEKNLKLLYDLAKCTTDNLKYCGTFSCGEEVI
ncbi:hypothetical protein KQI88_15980 [Alkaliphilus sp. MSJ-5]|uniref:Uncharacterized protein n=1 Tax=Alkaliphilus flagellatus TaxID=2841507 RepID=A0ABS6G605_9FIRM|nr:hypothetical protein [Alkaliphilus flagellatus]MBU5677917.1 hypothetical protein [Alkaliphilus flagellatus]